MIIWLLLTLSFLNKTGISYVTCKTVPLLYIKVAIFKVNFNSLSLNFSSFTLFVNLGKVSFVLVLSAL